METPNKEEKLKSETSPVSRHESTPNISLLRKILIGLFILGFWIFFYWFREP
ncbi:MAG: hypothetical protein VX227_04460 [Nitrospinota bacterium]|nr:hypothetical protein [Nitrospinota bacterium]MEE3253507.1 hypothetical protein [Nitrospinota bacterium]